MRISDWSSDVCSSDLLLSHARQSNAVLGDQRLVGGHDMLAVGERRLHQLARNAVRTADQFDDNIYVGSGGERTGIGFKADTCEVDAAILRGIARADGGKFKGAPGGGGQKIPAVGQNLEHAAADSAERSEERRGGKEGVSTC